MVPPFTTDPFSVNATTLPLLPPNTEGGTAVLVEAFCCCPTASGALLDSEMLTEGTECRAVMGSLLLLRVDVPVTATAMGDDRTSDVIGVECCMDFSWCSALYSFCVAGWRNTNRRSAGENNLYETRAGVMERTSKRNPARTGEE